MYRLKRVLLLACLLCGTISKTAYADNEYFTVHDTDTKGLYITYKDNVIDFGDAQPFINDQGAVQVPVRIVSEMLDKEVEWIEDTRSVLVYGEDSLIKFTIGSNMMYINDDKAVMESTAQIVNGCTYVPLSFVSDTFDIQVWYIPSENNIPDEVLSIEVKPTDITIEDIADRLYSQGLLLEDQRDGMMYNIIKDEDIYRGENITYDHKTLLNEVPAVISAAEGYTIGEVQKKANSDLSEKPPLDLSAGMIEFVFPKDTSVYQYETAPVKAAGGSILIDYFPKKTSFADLHGEGTVIYLMAYDRETGTGPFKVGYVYCSYGERTVAKAEGLRSDREYVLKILNDTLFGQDNAVIRIVRF